MAPFWILKVYPAHLCGHFFALCTYVWVKSSWLYHIYIKPLFLFSCLVKALFLFSLLQSLFLFSFLLFLLSSFSCHLCWSQVRYFNVSFFNMKGKKKKKKSRVKYLLSSSDEKIGFILNCYFVSLDNVAWEFCIFGFII